MAQKKGSGLSDKLTPREEKFAQYIAMGMGNTEAYLKAGYADNKDRGTVRNNAWVLKNVPKVKKRIEELFKMAEDETIMTLREVLQSLTKMANGEAVEENVVTDKNGNYTIVTTKAKCKEQAKALELLGKYHKAFTDKQEVSGNLGVNITFEDDLDEQD